MATIQTQLPEAAGTISGNQFRVQTFAVNTNLVLNGGELVSLDTTGFVTNTAVIATPTSTVKLLGFLIHGISQANPWFFGVTLTGQYPMGALGGTFGGTFMGSTPSGGLLRSIEGTGAHVNLADSDNLFEVNLASSSGNVLTATFTGAGVGLIRDPGAGIWVADITQAGKLATIMGWRGGPQLGVVGDTGARVILRFLNSVYALGF